MKVILSTTGYETQGAHGGSVIARRHGSMLRRAGVDVFVFISSKTGAVAKECDTFCYGYSNSIVLFPEQRSNSTAHSELTTLFREIKPDLLYDVHGPMWPIEVAVECGVPVVSMIGDYNWFCQRTFLVDSWLKRCTGPESITKCYTCLRKNDTLKRRLLQSTCLLTGGRAILGALMGDGRVSSFDLWGALNESRSYLQSLRQQVSHFVVGDQQAEEFFLSQGIPSQKIRRIPQALPEEALVRRPRSLDCPIIDRPLRIGYVGRLDADKGFRILARAFEALPCTASVELWVVHATAATEDRVGRNFSMPFQFQSWLATGRVKLFQPTSTEELYSLMAQIDVGVIPSIQYEAPCLVMLELVAQQTPIIRSESKGMEHVIRDGINGRTFPYGDWQALRDIVLEIIEQPNFIEQWRSKLPVIDSDDVYAQRLLEVFASIV